MALFLLVDFGLGLTSLKFNKTKESKTKKEEGATMADLNSINQADGALRAGIMPAAPASGKNLKV